MFKDGIIWLIIALLGYLIGGFYFIRNTSLTEKNRLLTDNLDIALSKYQAVQEAASLREQEYKEIEAKVEVLDKQLENIKDEESINWLEAKIPADIDNTIPY